MTETEELIARLDTLLDQERNALLEGDLESLNQLVDEKEALIHSLSEAELDEPEGLRGVSDKVSRNQALLEGALDGIRNAARRLAEIRQARKSLDTYDETGRKQRIDSDVSGKLEKRA